ncbi:MAG: PocR ligand-binding domain-containing protein [Melioribacteraceae bacterium]|nr:PocR ligand-binding domain-containing protein [Melioribacteraceae bacterium]
MKPVDIECKGGIRLYAIPIKAGDETIGAINFGYSDPPKDQEKLTELSENYNVSIDKLIEKSKEYETRPPYVIETAKKRLQSSAHLIGEIVNRKLAEDELKELKNHLEVEVKQKTEELQQRVSELERFHEATIDRELRMKQLREEIKRLKGEK